LRTSGTTQKKKKKVLTTSLSGSLLLSCSLAAATAAALADALSLLCELRTGVVGHPADSYHKRPVKWNNYRGRFQHTSFRCFWSPSDSSHKSLTPFGVSAATKTLVNFEQWRLARGKKWLINLLHEKY